jgi:hypothetical protein
MALTSFVEETAHVEETSSSSLENLELWRVLSNELSSESIASELRKRGIWSNECFDDALALYQKFTASQDSYVAGPIAAALHCLDHAYRLYGPTSVICSFNGGKDAVVILQLVRAALAHYYDSTQQEEIVKHRPRVIYFDHADEFPEITTFLKETVEL